MRQLLLGIDLGGTGTRVVLTDADGIVLAHRSVPTSTAVPGAVDDLIAHLDHILSTPISYLGGASDEPNAGSTLTAIGVGASGPVDSAGMVQNPATLPAFTGIDLISALHARFDTPVVVDNDAVAAAYGESKIGVAQGVPSVLAVTLGTGIGVALITDGQAIRTASGTHPEAGHLLVPGDAPCYCGRESCWEQHASRSALQKQARLLGLDLETAHERAQVGDPESLGLFERYGAAVGVGLADLLTIWGPDIVVLGGGGARFLNLYRPALEAALARVVGCYGHTAVVASKLGDLAGATGAGLLARDRGID